MSVVGARVAGDMKRGSLPTTPPAEALVRVVREIAQSFQAGLELAWLVGVWIALHLALGALALAKVVLLVIGARPSRHD